MRLPVAVIARAWRTPLGNTVDDAMARLFAGERAAIADPRGAYGCSVVAPVRGEPAQARAVARYLRRMGLFGMEVAREALAASGIAGGPRVGLFAGVGGLRAHWDDMLAALEHQTDDGAQIWERGLREVHPYWMLRHLSNNVHALASATLSLRGEGATFGGGNGGAQAIAAAARALWDGAIDAALVVAYDSLLEPETLVELGARRAATRSSLAALVAPYDGGAAGYVPGEAAAALVLVRESPNAIARVAAIDAADGEPGTPHAETLARAVRSLRVPPPASVSALDASRSTASALDAGSSRNTGSALDASLSRDTGNALDASSRNAASASSRHAASSLDATRTHRAAIGYVDGTANAWPDLDAAERAMLGDLVEPGTPLTALTAAMGHLGAATALVQTIALAESLRRGTIPPIAALVAPTDGPLVPVQRVTPTQARTALGLHTCAPGLAGAIHVEVE